MKGNNKITYSSLILVTVLSILFSVYTIFSYRSLLKENIELKETMENQNKLIKILEISCERGCEE